MSDNDKKDNKKSFKKYYSEDGIRADDKKRRQEKYGNTDAPSFEKKPEKKLNCSLPKPKCFLFQNK